MAEAPKGPRTDFNEGIYHRPPTGPSFVTIGIVAAILIVIAIYLAFVKTIPFVGAGYEVTATFENAATLRNSAPVRIAGVNVGEVTNVQLDGETAKVTFTVDDEGRPLHADSQVTIRPRLFLEGNFFLDLRPGSPSAPELGDGGSIPITQTQTAVQLDQVLTSLQQPDRRNLARLLDGYGSALADQPTAAEDRGQDPQVRGLSGAAAINESFRYGGRAGKGTAQVSQALLGEQSGDLARLIDKTGVVFSKLASREAQLRSLISNLSITVGALAAESGSLRETVAELAPTLEQAEPSLVALNDTLPPLRAFARDLTPGVEELPDTIDAGTPWLRQTRALVQPDELGFTARNLKVAQPSLAAATSDLAGLLPQLRSTSRCVTRTLDPAGDLVIDDAFSTGDPNYNEFFYAAASQSGLGGNFDGNGQMLRTQTGGGPVLVNAPATGGIEGQTSPVWGYTIQDPTGTQPVRPSSDPPIRTDQKCQQQDLPDVNGPAAAVGDPTPSG
jgi:phospholipid/cholesterol/gamma-HCH transport system substrate-binding protein